MGDASEFRLWQGRTTAGHLEEMVGGEGCPNTDNSMGKVSDGDVEVGWALWSCSPRSEKALEGRLGGTGQIAVGGFQCRGWIRELVVE